MKTLFLVFCLFSLHCILEPEDPIREIVKIVNSNPKSTWVASEDFAHDLPYSVFKSQARGISMTPLSVREEYRFSKLHANLVSRNLPTSFDARVNWPQCTSIGAVLNQGNCGSCFTFSTSESFVDRLCISSSGSTALTPSPQHLVNCDRTCFPSMPNSCNGGCNGGFPDLAFKYIISSGTVSGTCLAYRGTAQTCSSTCDDGTPMTKYYASGRAWLDSEEAIMTALTTDGPVSATFQLYTDFRAYRSGVYQQVTGTLEGGHAVKVIGYGTEGGVNYWLALNSWGTTFGDSGAFKIRRGANLVLFDQDMWAIYTRTTSMPTYSTCQFGHGILSSTISGECHPIHNRTLAYCSLAEGSTCVAWDAHQSDRMCFGGRTSKPQGLECQRAFRTFCCGLYLPSCSGTTTTPVCRSACTAYLTTCGLSGDCSSLPETGCITPPQYPLSSALSLGASLPLLFLLLALLLM